MIVYYSLFYDMKIKLMLEPKKEERAYLIFVRFTTFNLDEIN